MNEVFHPLFGMIDELPRFLRYRNDRAAGEITADIVSLDGVFMTGSLAEVEVKFLRTVWPVAGTISRHATDTIDFDIRRMTTRVAVATRRGRAQSVVMPRETSIELLKVEKIESQLTEWPSDRRLPDGSALRPLGVMNGAIFLYVHDAVPEVGPVAAYVGNTKGGVVADCGAALCNPGFLLIPALADGLAPRWHDYYSRIA